jgi:hypothetical protein
LLCFCVLCTSFKGVMSLVRQKFRIQINVGDCFLLHTTFNICMGCDYIHGLQIYNSANSLFPPDHNILFSIENLTYCHSHPL